jgi:hypothetical protein
MSPSTQPADQTKRTVVLRRFPNEEEAEVQPRHETYDSPLLKPLEALGGRQIHENFMLVMIKRRHGLENERLRLRVYMPWETSDEVCDTAGPSRSQIDVEGEEPKQVEKAMDRKRRPVVTDTDRMIVERVEAAREDLEITMQSVDAKLREEAIAREQAVHAMHHEQGKAPKKIPKSKMRWRAAREAARQTYTTGDFDVLSGEYEITDEDRATLPQEEHDEERQVRATENIPEGSHEITDEDRATLEQEKQHHEQHQTSKKSSNRKLKRRAA